MSYITFSGQGTTRSLECMCQFTLPCRRAPNTAQVSNVARQVECDFTPLHLYPLPLRIALQPRCKSYGTAPLPTFRATRATHPRLPGPQTVRRLQAQCSLPDIQDPHQVQKPVAPPATLLSEQTWRDFVTDSHA